MQRSSRNERELVLPRATKPASAPLSRRHRPEGKYPTFRKCLRWEFGFSCAICLVHESDLVAFGAQGTGLMSIEHRRLRSSGEDVDRYENCLYVCRYCNGSRGSSPLTDSLGRTLLDPTRVAWSEHFSLEHDHLVAKPESADAVYTGDTYKINTPRRTSIRCRRREELGRALEALALRPKLLARPERSDLATELSTLLRRAESSIARFRFVPDDAPASCRCVNQDACSLPTALHEQGQAVR